MMMALIHHYQRRAYTLHEIAAAEEIDLRRIHAIVLHWLYYE
jgi:hypothetical protein